MNPSFNATCARALIGRATLRIIESCHSRSHLARWDKFVRQRRSDYPCSVPLEEQRSFIVSVYGSVATIIISLYR